jgi:hypothetical protein
VEKRSGSGSNIRWDKPGAGEVELEEGESFPNESPLTLFFFFLKVLGFELRLWHFLARQVLYHLNHFSSP